MAIAGICFPDSMAVATVLSSLDVVTRTHVPAFRSAALLEAKFISTESFWPITVLRHAKGRPGCSGPARHRFPTTYAGVAHGDLGGWPAGGLPLPLAAAGRAPPAAIVLVLVSAPPALMATFTASSIGSLKGTSIRSRPCS